MAFVPGGPAREESQHLTREADLQARHHDALRDAERLKRDSLVKRLLRKLRRAR